MLSIEKFREQPDKIKQSQKKRGEPTEIVDQVRQVDKKWREKLEKLQELRHKRNKLEDKIQKLKTSGKDAEKEIEQMKQLKEKVDRKQEKVDKLKQKREKLRKKVPIILNEDVPQGEDEDDNVEIRREGEIPEFDFEPRYHVDILEKLDMFDRKRGSKVTGSDFYFLKKDMVNLDLALKQFAIDHLVEKGYERVLPPFLVNQRVYEGMVGNPEDLGEAGYQLKDKDYYLIPTAEFPLGGMRMDETILEKDLPVRMVGHSPSFRREGGTEGKYSRGLYRVHQFNKVEQFVICKPEQSWDLFEEIQKNAEELYQKLGLTYRVVNVCTGDMGAKAAKKFDIECWMADGNFHETGSCSNCLDYQARDLDIKYREKKGAEPEGYAHTLNNTALAMSRTIIAIVEQYQQEDGSIKIPEALRPYMNGQKYIRPKEE